MTLLEFNTEKILVKKTIIDIRNKTVMAKINPKEKDYICVLLFWNLKSVDNLFITDDNTVYTLFNCRFGLSESNLYIYFDTLLIGAKIPDLLNSKCSEISLSFDHTKINMVDVEESLGKELNFKHNAKEYKINLNFNPREYELTIIYNNRQMIVKNLIHRLLEFYTFISFSIGQYYLINYLKLKVNDKEIKYYPNLNNKFNVKKKDSFTNQVLFKLKKTNVSILYSKWLIIRKQTHAIFDLYLLASADCQFEDISLSFMINILEGYSKVMHMKELMQLIIYNTKKNNSRPELNVILEYFYFQKKYSNLILTKIERKKYKTNSKLVNHRNYFDHLDEEKDRYYGHDCVIMFAKLNLIFRVQVLQDLNVNIDIDKIKENIEKINKKL